MKVTERKNGGTERRILIGMIVDDEVLSRISGKWTKEGLCGSRWSNLVAGWCISYHKKYGKAPGKAIVGLFESWSTDNRDKETIELVERFLEGLSGEYEQLAKDSNSRYLVDLAADHFDKVRLSKLAEAIQGDLDIGDLKKARQRHERSKPIEMSVTSRVDLLSDAGALKRALKADSTPPLIEYPGALGTFFKKALKRGKFVSFMSPTKVGKTRWLTDLTWRAISQGNKVAFFAIGDEDEDDMAIRFMTRAARRPLGPAIGVDVVKWPISIERIPGEHLASVQHQEIPYEDAMDVRFARKAFRKVADKYSNTNRGELLGLSCHPSLSIGVDGIAEELDQWERDGWGSPDILVIDYADNLGAGGEFADARDGINATWQKMRGLSQKRNMLVVTATQSDSKSYDAKTLSKSNFTNDRRKLDHVTGMIGINVSEQEKAVAMTRLNWIVLRKGKFLESECVYCAGCPEIENPAALSIF